MKVIAYTALHYGAEYLAYAARSVIDHVDEWHVLYSPVGSHGHRTELPCPDSRETLLKIAMQAGGDKLRWWDGDWTNEGQQRMTVHQVATDADVILVLDSDEIWPKGLIDDVMRLPANGAPVRRLVVPCIHYWRSFYWAITADPAAPTRIIYPKVENDGEFYYSLNKINHFGYAQPAATVYYKQHTHGHKGEWRRDINWYQDRFLANAQVDCHPVGSEWWNPETVNPLDYMPDFMQQHPNWNKDLIE